MEQETAPKPLDAQTRSYLPKSQVGCDAKRQGTNRLGEERTNSPRKHFAKNKLNKPQGPRGVLMSPWGFYVSEEGDQNSVKI